MLTYRRERARSRSPTHIHSHIRARTHTCTHAHTRTHAPPPPSPPHTHTVYLFVDGLNPNCADDKGCRLTPQTETQCCILLSSLRHQYPLPYFATLPPPAPPPPPPQKKEEEEERFLFFYRNVEPKSVSLALMLVVSISMRC